MFKQTKEGTALSSISMKNGVKALACMVFVATGVAAQAHTNNEQPKRLYTSARLTPIIADVELLRTIGIEPKAIEPQTNVGFAEIDPSQEAELSRVAHQQGRCGGFEALHELKYAPESLLLPHVFGQLAEQERKNRSFRPSMELFGGMEFKPLVKQAVDEVSADHLRETVRILSSFPDRDNRGANANVAIQSFKSRIEEMMKGVSIPYQVELVRHNSTPQQSIRVRLPGSKRPSEIIVLGGHVDSINQDWFGSKGAPGADDNASGSANILETLRILSTKAQPERTIEFMWYAGEESGLLGSAEIAKEYKAQNKDVIAVLQLDMTLFPGDGQAVIASMNDFTSSWLRSYLQTLNTMYLNVRILDDKCGYGCSDHASWYRQGYPTLMPAEASFRRMNKNLHTARDVIDTQTSFEHSAIFSKIAVAIAMDLGNSTMREPAQ